jgi:hypothetical protein
MARLGDINPQATRLTFTMCPGTDVYMPPEAVRAQPVYSEKVDCFSFGVVVVQILSRQFPKPGDRLKTVRTNDPQFPRGIIEVRVSEVERRHNHISQIDNDQPLMLIANDCLKDDDTERPSAQQLLERVTVLKESPEYIESARPVQEILNEKEVQIREAQERIRTLNSNVDTKEQELRVREQDIEAKNATIATLEEEKIELQQHMESQRKEYNMAIAQKNQAIERIRAEKQNLQTKFENEQQVHVEVIAEHDQMTAEKEELIRQLQGVMRAKEERYHTELILLQERHVQEIVEQAETIAARENEIQKLHENMKRESEKFQQENQKYRQESERVQQELQKKKEEIVVLRERVRNENMKFQQELLRYQQQHFEDIKEKNQAMIKESQQPLSRGELEFILSQCCRATVHLICYFLVAYICNELWELLKPYCKKWYQLGIKFGVDRRDLRSLIPYGYGIPEDPQQCLELMLKMRFDKCKVTLLDAVMVLARHLAKPHS